MTKTTRALAVLATLAILAGGCRAMTGHTLGENIDNRTITASVKTKLTADSLHNLTWVDVDTNNGVVYLTGNARTAAEKTRAEEIAGHVNGVKRVVNNIQVQGTADRGATSAGSRSSSAAPAPSASPRSPSTAPPVLTGQVTSVDHNSGAVTVRTADGQTLDIRLPASAMRDLQSGDRITLSVTR